MRQIRTHHVYPPIPLRQFDWQAWYDGEEDEHMDHGEGPTEEAAIRDLIENYPRCREKVPECIGAIGECLLCEAENGVTCREVVPDLSLTLTRNWKTRRSKNTR